MISVDQWRAAIGCFCPKALSIPIVTGEQGGDVVLALMYVLMIHIVFHIKMACRTGYTFMKSLFFFVCVAYYYAIWTCYVCCIRHPLTVCKVGMLAYQVYMYLMCGHVDTSPQVPVLCLRYTADDYYTCLMAVVLMCALAVCVCRKACCIIFDFVIDMCIRTMLLLCHGTMCSYEYVLLVVCSIVYRLMLYYLLLLNIVVFKVGCVLVLCYMTIDYIVRTCALVLCHGILYTCDYLLWIVCAMVYKLCLYYLLLLNGIVFKVYIYAVCGYCTAVGAPLCVPFINLVASLHY